MAFLRSPRLMAMLKRLAAAALTAVALVSFAGCTADSDPGSTPASPTSEGVASPSAGESELTFEGDVASETVMVGPQEVTVPKGIKLPDSSLVSDSQELSVMLIDEDPAAVIEAVTNSAKESGYEVYSEPDESTTVFVGHGNAVRLFAVPQAQMLIWGPESMKDVLSQPGM